MLIDICPECGRRIKCIRRSLSLCSCGFDWRNVEPEFLPPNELTVSRRIYELADLLSSQTGERNNPSYSLSLRDFALVITFIAGAGERMAWATGRPAKSINLRNKDLHRLFTIAYAVLEDWPHNFYPFVQDRSKGETRLNPCGGKLDTALRREFGSFYEHLYQDLKGNQFDFLREAFAQLLTNRLKLHVEPSNRESSVPQFNGADKYVSVNEARRSLKITHNALCNFIDDGEIDFIITNRSKIPEFALSWSDVKRLKCKFEQSLTSRDLAKQLGLECAVVRELGQTGYLQTRWRPAVDGFRTVKFDRYAADKFLHKLARAKTVRSHTMLRSAVNFNEAYKAVASQGITAAAFVKAILDGQIQPCAANEDMGVERFLFAKSELSRYLSNYH